VTRRRVFALAVTVGLTLAGAAACGRKGPAVYPELRLPQAVTDLGGTVREGGVDLSWTIPRRRVDNTPMRDATAARVFRTEDAGAGEPKPALLVRNRVAGYTEIATIRLDNAPALQDGRLVYRDTSALQGDRRYTYVVLTEDSRGRVSPPSTRVSLQYVAAPEAPRALRAEAGEQQARLSWEAPTQRTDGHPVSGPLEYEVLRAGSPDGPLAPVGRTPAGVTSFTDRRLENDRAYSYAVRAIGAVAGGIVLGEPSARVTVTPTDMTPPSPPANLVAIPSVGTVRLSWSPSPERDVAGYVVYRAAGAGALARIGSTPVLTTVFVDRDVPPGQYRYAVTARDAGARANESARGNEVTVSVP
jgi:uncharacterized protein